MELDYEHARPWFRPGVGGPSDTIAHSTGGSDPGIAGLTRAGAERSLSGVLSPGSVVREEVPTTDVSGEPSLVGAGLVLRAEGRARESAGPDGDGDCTRSRCAGVGPGPLFSLRCHGLLRYEGVSGREEGSSRVE